jgi:hypothetical protein
MNGVAESHGHRPAQPHGDAEPDPRHRHLKQSSVDKGRDMEEFFGPAASVVKSAGDALESLATGHPDRAAMALAPSAVRNLAQGAKMADKGYSEDAKGRKGVPVNGAESGAKMIGFNPKSVADYGTIKRDLAQDQRMVAVKREEFSSAIADAIASQGDAQPSQRGVCTMKSQEQDGLDGNEKVPWPKWADMSASGKFVVLVFWFMVIQLINAIFG